MDIFDIISLFGGLAMFLYGMRLMGDSLKENSSGTLKRAMEKVTNNPVKAFMLGLLVTALIQSSTATIVITAGLVSAGILTLKKSLGIIVGANVGTTVTGQIIRLLDIDSTATLWLRFFQPSTLAPIALIIGIVLIMTNLIKNSRSVGNIAIGFGILFSGLLNMTQAVSALTESGVLDSLFANLGANPVIGYFTGALVAFILQSSSATIGILQAFSASGLLTFKAIYAVIVGVYLGDCVTTGIVCSIGAKAESKRVGMINILFNFGKSVIVLLGVLILHKMGLMAGIWDITVNSGIIANTNTIFNLTCSALLLPLMSLIEKLSCMIVKDDTESTEKYEDKLEGLNPVFFATPALALRSCYDLLLTIFESSHTNLKRSFGLIDSYDDKVYDQINRDEEMIDHLTDRGSRYMAELLPNLQLEDHVIILNEYYKVITDFEHLGDHAVNIAENISNLSKNDTQFSYAAKNEIHVLIDLTEEMMGLAEQTFSRRDIEAAKKIEPLVQLTSEVINSLKKNHFRRLSNQSCNIYADVSFTNLMAELKDISNVCSNIGVATVIRVHPELADHEHLYFDSLHSGTDDEFNTSFREAHDRYFARLNALSIPAEEN